MLPGCGLFALDFPTLPVGRARMSVVVPPKRPSAVHGRLDLHGHRRSVPHHDGLPHQLAKDAGAHVVPGRELGCV